jgi:hypothetical protein
MNLGPLQQLHGTPVVKDPRGIISTTVATCTHSSTDQGTSNYHYLLINFYTYQGTKAVEGITLDISKVEDLYLKSNSFTEMSEMRFLKFYYGKCNSTSNIYLPKNGLDSLSDKLRYLEWHRYCLKSLPSQFRANLLVELSMPYSNLQKLWEGVQVIKV